jgi:hypothetical protein
MMNMLMLSSFSGMVNAMPSQVASTCCKENKYHNHCQDQKRTENKDCTKNSCNVLLSCGTCGFLVIPFITIFPAFQYLENPVVPVFIAGELTDYYGDGWNPPKA